MLKKITQKELKKLLHYNPITGDFTWVNHKRDNAKNGTVAGWINKSTGYMRIGINNCHYRTHRLAWIYMTGIIPEEIDHINHKRSDNRWVNLRAVSRSENGKNLPMLKNNTSSFNGVGWHKKSSKFRAYIKVNKKLIGLGIFAEKEDAIEARKHANKLYGFHANHGKKET